MAQNSGKKCICFVRVSTEMQDLSQQTDQVIAEAERHGYDKAHQIVIEWKESATMLTKDERKGISELESYVQTDPNIDCVFIYELSRLSRRPADLYLVRDFLIERHINLISMTPSMVMLDANGKLDPMAAVIFGIFSAMAEQEGYIRKERLARGRAKNKAEGKAYGGKFALGYKTDKNHFWMIDENTAPIVRRIFETYAHTHTPVNQLAKELQEEGYYPNTDITTLHCTLLQILRNPHYKGTDNFPAIVTPELWDEAQARMQINKQVYKSRKTTDYLLKGIIFDAKTGLRLSPNAQAENYFCKRAGVRIAHTLLDKFVWDIAMKIHKKYVSNPEKQVDEYKKKFEVWVKKLEVAKQKQDAVQEKIDRIEKRFVDGKISENRANELEMGLVRERKMIQDTIDHYNNLLSNGVADIKSIRDEKEYDYSKLNQDEKIAIVKMVIEKVIVERIDKKIAMIWIVSKVTNKKMQFEFHSHTYEFIKVSTKTLTDEETNATNQPKPKRKYTRTTWTKKK